MDSPNALPKALGLTPNRRHARLRANRHAGLRVCGAVNMGQILTASFRYAVFPLAD